MPEKSSEPQRGKSVWHRGLEEFFSMKTDGFTLPSFCRTLQSVLSAFGAALTTELAVEGKDLFKQHLNEQTSPTVD